MEKQLTKELKKAIDKLNEKFGKDKLYEKYEKSHRILLNPVIT